MAGDASGFLTGITDLEIVQIGGQDVLYTAGGWGSGLRAFEVADTGGVTVMNQQSYVRSLGNFSAISLEQATIAGQSYLVTLSPADRGIQGYGIGADGAFTDTTHRFAIDGEAPEAPHQIAFAGVFAFVGQSSGGIATYRILSDGSLRHVIETGGDTVTGHASALAAIEIDGQAFVIGCFANNDQIVSYRVESRGRLTPISTLGAEVGFGIDSPTAIEVVTLQGTTYAIVAAAGTHTLSVLELGADGTLIPTDHVMDTLHSRFGSVSALEVVTYQDQVFVLAGGGDDGISLLALTPAGRLVHLGSVADTTATTLENVSAIAAAVAGNGLQVFVTSLSEAGMTQFEVDLRQYGGIFESGVLNETLQGTAGDDILLSGPGRTTMTGGLGADIFVFDNDGTAGLIRDYQPGVDRLDLSMIPMLHDASQLTIVSTATGAMVYFGTFELEIISATRSPLTAQDIRLDTSVSHLALGNVTDALPDGQVIFGTEGDDVLMGGSGSDVMKGLAGDDLLLGGDGDDTLDGGDGIDVVSFADATGRCLVDLQFDVSSAGFARFFRHGSAAGVQYANIEVFEGSDYADNLRGDASSNILFGGGVSDRLYGRAGDDILNGDAGADALYGNQGADIMSGGDSDRRDRFIYFDASDSGVSEGQRDIITDFTPGQDRIEISRLDANVIERGKQRFDFISDAPFSGVAGQLRFDSDAANNWTLVQADLNGDGVADFEIELSGVLYLTLGDFLL